MAVGTELTTGATRDTNSGELARELTGLGVQVLRATALPDQLAAVTSEFRAALGRADLIVSTGGLGPTPDDLTREAIAAACGLELHVDTELEAWLRRLFERRGLVMPDANRKQAWLVDGAVALPNGHGSAPGWWLERPDGRVIVALPGPPREMWPMWRDHALPRLHERELGVPFAAHTLRLTGVGESQLVDLIGEDVLRADNPQVATYARPDAVDVVVKARAADASAAARTVDEMVTLLRSRVGQFIFAEGDQTWTEALAARMGTRTLTVVESGTGGHLTAMLGGTAYLVRGELLNTQELHDADELGDQAARAREQAGADIGLAIHAEEHHGDTRVRIALATVDGVDVAERIAFLTGEEGRRRAALAACAVLWLSLDRKNA